MKSRVVLEFVFLLKANDQWTYSPSTLSPLRRVSSAEFRWPVLSAAGCSSETRTRLGRLPREGRLNSVVGFPVGPKTTGELLCCWRSVIASPDASNRHYFNSHRERIPMLVLSRKLNESIRIGDDVWVTVSSIQGDKVRLGITAPRSTNIARCEIDQMPNNTFPSGGGDASQAKG